MLSWMGVKIYRMRSLSRLPRSDGVGFFIEKFEDILYVYDGCVGSSKSENLSR